MKVLIFGLSGSGKTSLAKELAYHFQLPHYNADTIREFYNDWDFSEPARHRSAHRMSQFEFGILDFICPKKEYRKLVDADIIVWMDTITKGRYDDTNEMFKKPNINIEHIDYHFTKLDSDAQSDRIVDDLELFDTYHWKKSNG